jgi:putative Mn2+ efflux pump MntP
MTDMTLTLRSLREYRWLALVATALCLGGCTLGMSGSWEFYNVWYYAWKLATGYLGRTLALVGGLLGLVYGAACGRLVYAVMGIVLAVFGSIGPDLVNAIFGFSATL